MVKGILVLIILLIASTAAPAQDYTTAAGIRIRSDEAVVNHSLTFKHFINDSWAGEAMFSFDPVSLGILFEKHNTVGNKGFRWFWGAGPYVAFSDDRRFGLHCALGLDIKFPEIPFNLSVDWKPELNLAHQFSFEPAAVGLSARFVLK